MGEDMRFENKNNKLGTMNKCKVCATCMNEFHWSFTSLKQHHNPHAWINTHIYSIYTPLSFILDSEFWNFCGTLLLQFIIINPQRRHN